MDCLSCTHHTDQTCELNRHGYPNIGSLCAAYDADIFLESLEHEGNHRQLSSNTPSIPDS